MAKIPQGILGGISGKIGGIVGSSWKGINVIKTKPLSVANPKTAGQVAQRNLFGNTVAFAVVILATIIKPLWDRFASRQSGFNAFIQANITLFAATLPAFGTGFKLAQGKMAKTTLVIGAIAAADVEIAVSWTDDSGSGYKLATDVPYLLMINQTSGEVIAMSLGVTRNAESDVFTTGAIFTEADVIDMYMVFRRVDGTIVSNTSSAQVSVGA